MRASGFSRHAFSSCVTAAMLAGCGGSQPPIGASDEAVTHPSIHAFDGSSWISRDANPNHPWLYVASNSNNKIDIYDV
jgi:hypothetical protein